MTKLSALVRDFLDLYKFSPAAAKSAIESAFDLESDEKDRRLIDEGNWKGDSEIEERIPRVFDKRTTSQSRTLLAASAENAEDITEYVAYDFLLLEECDENLKRLYQEIAGSEGLTLQAWVERENRRNEEAVHIRLGSPNPEIALMRDFLDHLDSRLANYNVLGNLNLGSAPEHVRQIFHEACDCYLSNHRYAAIILCGTSIEAAIAHIANRPFTGLSEALDFATDKRFFGDDGTGGIDDDLKALRNHAVHKPERFYRVAHDKWMQALLNTRKLLEILFDDRKQT